MGRTESKATLWVVMATLALAGCERLPASMAGRIVVQLMPMGETPEGTLRDLRFSVVDDSGLPVGVSAASLEVLASGSTGWAPGPVARVRPGQVYFPGVELAVGVNQVRISVTQRGTGAQGSTLERIRLAPELTLRSLGHPQTIRLQPSSAQPLVNTRIPVVVGGTPTLQAALADSSLPAIASVSPAGTDLFVVAAANLHLLPTPTLGYVADKVPGGDGEVDISFVALNAAGGRASLRYAGVELVAPVGISGSPETVQFSDVSLPQDSAGLLEIVLTASGEQVTYSAFATVDVVAPAAPMLIASLAANGARSGTVDLSWTGGGDDGTLGQPAGFDLRWTSNAVSPAGITDEDRFQDLAKVKRVSGGLFPAEAVFYQLSGLPPLASYFLQARAVDEVGNLSPLGTQRQVDNFWSQTQLTSGSPDYTGFGFKLEVADLNDDGKSDLIVPASDAEEVRIFYGQASLGSWSPTVLAGPAGSSAFGAAVSAGDVTGDGRSDLLVGADQSEGRRGHAFLYFGRFGQMDPTYVKFRGTQGTLSWFGGGVQAIADVNGDGIGEVAISANGEGKTYIFFGRSKAAWLAAGTDVDPGGAYIPTSAADRVFDRSGGGATWGFQHGCVSLPDLTRDGRAELVLPTGGGLAVFSGSAISEAPGPISMGSALQTLAGVSGYFGFGSEVTSGKLLAADTVDLLVGNSAQNQLLIYPGGSGAQFPTAPMSVTGAGGFGTAVTSADLNGDGRADLVVGATWIGQSSTRVLFNTGSGYDAAAGAGFHQANLVGGEGAGISTAVGDFNGDGKPDVVSGDDVNGRVTVWY